MGRYGVGFNNRGFFTTYPSVFSNVYPDDLEMRNQGPTGTIALLGEGSGFLPPKVATSLPFWLGPPSRFLQAGSDLCIAAEFAVRPFTQFTGRSPAQIFVVPVSPATQATYTLDTFLKLTSVGYGPAFNVTTVKHETSLKPTLTLKLPGATTANDIVERYVDYGTVEALVADINARSQIARAELLAEGTLPALPETPFTGGTVPAATPADWADAFVALSPIRANVVSPQSGDPDVWAMLQEYCNRRRARGFVGSEATRDWGNITDRAASLGELKGEAALLNDPRIMHCGLGADGYPGKLAAARYAALASIIEPSVPMTQKQLNYRALETRLDPYGEVGSIEGLLMNGVSPPVPDPDAPSTYILSRGLSSWSGDDNLYRREQSVLAAVDGIQDTLEQAMRQFIGGEGSALVLARIRETTIGVLEEALKPTATIRIAGYDRDAVIVTFSSDTVVRVSCKITPIPPINFLVLNLILTRLEIEITTEVQLAA
jgi:hypothetical protein